MKLSFLSLAFLPLLPGVAFCAPPAHPARYPAKVFGPVTVLDQQDPRYQSSIDALANAAALLDQARSMVQASKDNWALPGFDYGRLTSDIGQISKQLDALLVPRTLRLRYRNLVPDDAYFLPAGREPTSAPASRSAAAVVPATPPTHLKLSTFSTPSSSGGS